MKIRRISDFQHMIRFPNLEEDQEKLFERFYQSDLGAISRAIPWDELVNVVGLKNRVKGPSSDFSPKGKLALMFLKSYTGLSDRKLVDQINSNLNYQIFCDLWLGLDTKINCFKIVSQIRCEIAELLDIQEAQMCLAEYWRPYMDNKSCVGMDATCYETSMRYPTDIKLMYELVEWNYKKLKKLSKKYGIKMIRSKIKKWRIRYSSYSKSRRPSKKIKRSLLRSLLRLAVKINDQLTYVERRYAVGGTLNYKQRRQTTQKIIEQQWGKFFEGEKIKDRIVSLDKPYIRPIVRGKEVKLVEFGAKVNKIQIDGISFIEKLSYDAFNEGRNYISSVYLSQKLMRTAVKLTGADAIYATNRNRRFATQKSIKNDFKRKGKPGKHHHHYKQLAKSITKERASRLEGSFGTEKEHYSLNRIKARTEKTETLWIFFGIHTANALNIGKRMALERRKAA